MDDIILKKLQSDIGYHFNEVGLLKLALTHRSMGSQHNERLEFLGDSILSYSVSNKLYKNFSQLDEGDMSRVRASLVNGKNLAKLGKNFEIGNNLIMGPGELKSGGYKRESILADAVEAIIGAIYLDSDILTVNDVILNWLKHDFEKIDQNNVMKDPKTQLQELLQSKKMKLPNYEVVEIIGKAHNQKFKVRCLVKDLSLDVFAAGTSRRKAEQASALKILEILQYDIKN